jgi:hypothetical protein
VRLFVLQAEAMELRNCSIALLEVLAGASLIFLIAAGVSVCTASAAYAQAVDGGGAPIDYLATSDASSEDNLDVPAPAADYDVPAKAGSVADADPEVEASAGTDSVLELPQVVDTDSYAVATLANAEVVLTDSNAPLSDAEDGGQLGSVGDNAATDAPSGASMNDAKDYQDQADRGPVVVYAEPVYAEPAPRYLAPMAGPSYSTLRAGAYDQRSIADVLRPHASGLRRYQVSTGTRLFNSRLDRGFVMPHRPMAGARWAHSR